MFKAASHTCLSPPKSDFFKIISLPHLCLQLSSIKQSTALAFKTYQPEQIFENFAHQLFFIATHLFRNQYHR